MFFFVHPAFAWSFTQGQPFAMLLPANIMMAQLQSLFQILRLV